MLNFVLRLLHHHVQPCVMWIDLKKVYSRERMVFEVTQEKLVCTGMCTVLHCMGSISRFIENDVK